uniref:ParA family protein n=1 Tax=Ndongobacter massiliensis TaxID=1871025 RepID=UPI00093190BA|nr:ParA family protein [Ndongobacter massiliensis]
MGRVIAVYNQKGGVGKTTTVVNLAAALGLLKQNVLVIDMDPQANSTSGLGLDKNEDEPDIYTVLSGEEPASRAIRETSAKNVRILPSSSALAGLEVEAVDRSDRAALLCAQTEILRDAYDYLLIDCPPSLGLLSLNALCAADSVIIPIQTEYYALEGVGQLSETIDLVRESLHPALALEGALLTMYDGRNNLSKEVEDEVRKYFGEQVFRTVIPRNIRLAEAPSYGESVFTYDRLSKGARTYMKLGKELLKKNRG